MGTMKDTPEASELRRRAEKKLAIEADSTELLSEMSPEKMASLIHELQVHQIELKMQNEELRSIQNELEKTRDRYSHLYDFAPIGYFALNQKGFIDEANLTIASMLGVDRGALIGKPFTPFLLRDDQDTFYKYQQRLLEMKTPQSCELRLVKKDGQEFYAHLECTVLKNKGNDLKQIRITASDVTERKQAEEALLNAHYELELRVEERTAELAKTNHELTAEIDERKRTEEALRESEERWQFALEGSRDGVWDWNALSNKAFFSIRWKEMLGYKEDEISNHLDEWNKRVHPDDKEKCYAELNKLLKGELPYYENEHRMLCKDGSYKWILDRGKVISWTKANEPHRVIGTHTDITDRKHAEEALRESEEWFRNIYERSPIGIELYDSNGNLLRANKACLEMFGVTDIAEIKGFKLLEDPNVTDEVKEALRRGETVRYEVSFDFELVKKHGLYNTTKSGVVILDVLITPISPHRGHLVQTQDTTDRRQAEEALRESEKRLIVAQHIANIGDFTWDVETGEVTWSDGLFDLLQYDKSERIDYARVNAEIHHSDDLERVTQWLNDCVASGKSELTPNEYRLVRKDGKILYVRTLGAIEHEVGKSAKVFATIQDITERKQMETQLQQSQKMEAVGTLAGGIAHDYNNLLAVVMGNLSMAQEEAEPHSLMAELLHEIEQASLKARDLTHQFLTLSQGGHPRKERGSIGSLLKEIQGQAQAHEASTAFSIQDDLRPVEFDSRQMHYAISNVLTNAVEAMPQGGTITIQAENKIIENKDKDSASPLKEGKYVKISIKDEGSGIPEKHLNRIFDPYFSTKEQGVQKGMGLGLATAYAIVEKHGGHIMVNSTTGVGTTISIYLPATAAESDVQRAERPELGPQSTINNQQSKIINPKGSGHGR